MKYLFATTILICCIFSHAQQIIVLGTAQDGGFPHIGCQNECLKAHKNPKMARYVTSLALVDPVTRQWWMFEASPDLDKQLQYFRDLTDGQYPYLPSGIFVTHAHIGHYTGLMFLGKEALGAKDVKVYALPKMIEFLKSDGPWSQLVSYENVSPIVMIEDQPLPITNTITVEAFTVPHRDEYSETAGFKISTLNKGYIFIPDIDKWYKWDRKIVDMVKDVTIDHAFIDATFFKDGELPNRPMSEMPHPFVEETMLLFDSEPASVKSKIKFIHLNHTNPLLFDKKAQNEVKGKGYDLAEQGEKY
ncbi:pyrroloquinoline quinone biosynthesis protein B [Ekhidna lutea]|uniref:Pyrroloquinoline quinone biosynthesis protein B n=1 Tax=Ekhidna lutea TaxID=447679 RepID=A0A239JKM5_EKHLU|nr:MBL fold metallo-hydrolase [Ekhidna lutea]SNT06385.1 pyrroloquinoline quinone biosynthesis protein B [Ekhidna lutea]